MVGAAFQDSANALTMRIEGRFVGKYAEEIKTFVIRNKIHPRRFVVDLSDMNLYR